VAATAAALAGCGERPGTGARLPETVAGGWRRQDLRDVPAGDGGEVPAPTSVRRLTRARYGGPGDVEVSLYELASSAAALDAVQRFRPAPDTVFFYRDRYFIVVRWQGAPDRRALGAFVRALEKSVAAK